MSLGGRQGLKPTFEMGLVCLLCLCRVRVWAMYHIIKLRFLRLEMHAQAWQRMKCQSVPFSGVWAFPASGFSTPHLAERTRWVGRDSGGWSSPHIQLYRSIPILEASRSPPPSPAGTLSSSCTLAAFSLCVLMIHAPLPPNRIEVVTAPMGPKEQAWWILE